MSGLRLGFQARKPRLFRLKRTFLEPGFQYRVHQRRKASMSFKSILWLNAVCFLVPVLGVIAWKYHEEISSADVSPRHGYVLYFVNSR